MKSSIKLKHGKELEEVMRDPILLSIIVQIAFNTDEETGEAVVKFPKRWDDKIAVLVVMGLIERNEATYSLTNKKVVDITLKRKPKRSEIDGQSLRDATIVPDELKEYYDLANHFWELFRNNLNSIGGRLHNLEKAKFGKWVTPVRLMIESDNVSVDELRAIYKFLDGHTFWRDKVQSTSKLREKLQTIHSQMRQNGVKTTIKKGTARTTESRRKNYA